MHNLLSYNIRTLYMYIHVQGHQGSCSVHLPSRLPFLEHKTVPLCYRVQVMIRHLQVVAVKHQCVLPPVMWIKIVQTLSTLDPGWSRDFNSMNIVLTSSCICMISQTCETDSSGKVRLHRKTTCGEIRLQAGIYIPWVWSVTGDMRVNFTICDIIMAKLNRSRF